MSCTHICAKLLFFFINNNSLTQNNFFHSWIHPRGYKGHRTLTSLVVVHPFEMTKQFIATTVESFWGTCSGLVFFFLTIIWTQSGVSALFKKQDLSSWTLNILSRLCTPNWTFSHCLFQKKESTLMSVKILLLREYVRQSHRRFIFSIFEKKVKSCQTYIQGKFCSPFHLFYTASHLPWKKPLFFAQLQDQPSDLAMNFTESAEQLTSFDMSHYLS